MDLHFEDIGVLVAKVILLVEYKKADIDSLRFINYVH